MKRSVSHYACPHCGPLPVHHPFEWFNAFLEGFFNKAFAPASLIFEGVVVFLGKLFAGDRTLWGMIRICSRLGMGTIVSAPDDRISLRGRSLWEAAESKGIALYEFRPFGRPNETFAACFGSEVRVFQGLPRPKGIDRRALLWMDDKALMREKFSALDIPVARGGVASSKRKALRIFETLRPPLIAKPNLGSRSRHTTVHIHTKDRLLEAFRIAKQLSPWVVIEEELRGFVYRATLIGGRLIGVARREPASVRGDGTHTVRELLDRENSHPLRNGVLYYPIPDGAAAEEVLKRQGFDWARVPPEDVQAFLGDKVSRRVGGPIIDVTDDVHAENRLLFERIGEVVGDPLIGIDFIIEDIARSWREQERCGVIELNSVPFLDAHAYPLYGKPRDAAGALWEITFSDCAEGNRLNRR